MISLVVLPTLPSFRSILQKQVSYSILYVFCLLSISVYCIAGHKVFFDLSGTFQPQSFPTSRPKMVLITRENKKKILNQLFKDGVMAVKKDGKPGVMHQVR